MSTMAYSLIQATTRALYSQMLTRAEWHTLIHTHDFEALLSELSDTVYGPYLELDRHLLTPRRVVYQIKRHLIDRYSKIIRLAPAHASDLIVLLARAFEVDNIKAALRGIETGATWEQVLFLLSPISAHAELSLEDMENMVRAGEILRAIERIENTPYYETLSHAVERYQSEHNLFPLEVALDLAYARELWQSIQQLPKNDQEYALRIVGTHLLIDNLLWALRYRIYHNLSEEEIINYTLPMSPRMTDNDIRLLARGEHVSEVIKRVFPKLTSPIPDNLEAGTQGLRSLELLLQRHLVKLCRSIFVGDPFQIGIPLAYLQLLEHEIRDLTTIIEAKASRLPPGTFMSQLEISISVEQHDVGIEIQSRG